MDVDGVRKDRLRMRRREEYSIRDLASTAMLRVLQGRSIRFIPPVHRRSGLETVQRMKRRILLVDDEVTVLLTLKAVLEISGFDVHTAASAREARSKIRLNEYHLVITDMRMENDAAGAEVVRAARTAS